MKRTYTFLEELNHVYYQQNFFRLVFSRNLVLWWQRQTFVYLHHVDLLLASNHLDFSQRTGRIHVYPFYFQPSFDTLKLLVQSHLRFIAFVVRAFRVFTIHCLETWTVNLTTMDKQSFDVEFDKKSTDIDITPALLKLSHVAVVNSFR